MVLYLYRHIVLLLSYQHKREKLERMGETLNIVFHRQEDGTYEVQAKESRSSRIVRDKFIPPYTGRQLSALQKKLGSLDSRDEELREIGQRLFAALCCLEPSTSSLPRLVSEQSVPGMVRAVIQRTLKRRGTVALTLSFGPGCEEFIRYPWELLHNGDHFLLVSGVFTLSRILLRPDTAIGCELPVHPPFRLLYISACPSDCVALETERSFEAMEQALQPLIDSGQLFLDRLEPPTFSQFVRYLNAYGGASMLNDSDTTIPCYAIHFDGHGAYGRLCPDDACGKMNAPDTRKCEQCQAPLTREQAQTYLCFCDEDGSNRFVDTHSLRNVLLSSDVRLAVFAACDTAAIAGAEKATGNTQKNRSSTSSRLTGSSRPAVDATLATALVTAQVPAVVAMPFSLQDDLSPTFVYHFYEALAGGRAIEEALARARQALLSMQQKSWFVPVLYRLVAEGEEAPVPFLITEEAMQKVAHPLAHLGPPANFVGRERELQDFDKLLTRLTGGNGNDFKNVLDTHSSMRSTQRTHHVALTGPAGIGKSAVALEVVRCNRDTFQGGIIGVSLQNGKLFSDAIAEIALALHLPVRTATSVDAMSRARQVQNTLRALASRELPCLLLLDSFEEIKDRVELESWLRFLSALPQEVIVLVTSRLNPQNMQVEGMLHCSWYEYHLNRMTNDDLLNLFSVLASESGLDQHIHLENPRQQQVLREICKLLDGSPLGAELIFGTARSINGRIYTPEAATRSLEEVRDDLRTSSLAGMQAVLEVSYNRLTAHARLLLSYLAAFQLPFNREQILLLVSSNVHLPPQEYLHVSSLPGSKDLIEDEATPVSLQRHWRAARDELVQASFMQFDSQVYTIHSQVRHFALAHLSLEEKRRVHRVVAAYYTNLVKPTQEELLAAFEHNEAAGEADDLREATAIAVRAVRVWGSRGFSSELLAIVRRAALHAARLNDQVAEGQIQACLGALSRQAGHYVEAQAYLGSSLALLRLYASTDDVAWTLYELARLASENGDVVQALNYAQEAREAFQNSANRRGEAWIQVVMGEVFLSSDRYAEAKMAFSQSLQAFQDLDEQEGQAASLYGRGKVAAIHGEYRPALQDYSSAQSRFTALQSHTNLAWVLLNTGLVQLAVGELELAEKLCSEANALFQGLGIVRGKARALCAIGDILLQKQQFSPAREYYEEAQALLTPEGNRLDSAHVFLSSGALWLALGEYLEAKDMYERAAVLSRSQGAQLLYARALCGSGDVARILTHFPHAEQCYKEAQQIVTDLELPAEQSLVLFHLGMLREAEQQYTDALHCWHFAYTLAKQQGLPLGTQIQQHIESIVLTHHLEEEYAARVKQDIVS